MPSFISKQISTVVKLALEDFRITFMQLYSSMFGCNLRLIQFVHKMCFSLPVIQILIQCQIFIINTEQSSFYLNEFTINCLQLLEKNHQSQCDIDQLITGRILKHTLKKRKSLLKLVVIFTNNYKNLQVTQIIKCEILKSNHFLVLQYSVV